MYTTFVTLALAVFYLDAALLVNAGLFVYQPFSGSTCRAGEPCLISWVDDGSRPLLSAVGVATVGLYTGKQQLVQTISPVDVAKVHSVTFTPNPAAGPNSDTYYIAITSTTLQGNNSALYTGWSPSFVLTGMTGSFDTPLPSAVSPISVPASLTQPSATESGTRTVTVGVIPTTIPSIPSPPPSSPSISTSSSSTAIVAPSSSTTVSSSSSSTSSRSLSSTSKLTTVISPPSSTSLTTSSSASPSPTSALSSNTSGSCRGASILSPLTYLSRTFDAILPWTPCRLPREHANPAHLQA
ncbi:hypothetical protein JR316_0013243 [Psilocybe cubensis]|uniref:Uncharacterized protein n=2 Tax=Psilocybe cubensis TaxID=181762 RepID=A0ACB8GGU0_PSICU|nr:hypothetical protein JR316_0013243 [Psilocybe cubensis]KAH9474778.1 hypothetical protein JR316_0013243 [Psilocybe cubensis]